MARVYQIIAPSRPAPVPLRDQFRASFAVDVPDVTEAMSLCAAALDSAANDVDREVRTPSEAIAAVKFAVGQMLATVANYENGEAR